MRDLVVQVAEQVSSLREAYLTLGRAALREGHAARDARLFVRRAGRPLTRGYVARRVRVWAQAARVKKRVTCHGFRHSVATHLLRGRDDIRNIQACWGPRAWPPPSATRTWSCRTCGA